jgi:hypothetical protein
LKPEGKNKNKQQTDSGLRAIERALVPLLDLFRGSGFFSSLMAPCWSRADSCCAKSGRQPRG